MQGARRMSRRRMLGLTGTMGIGAVGLALVGCGGDDDDNDGAPAPAQDQSARGKTRLPPKIQTPGGRVRIRPLRADVRHQRPNITELGDHSRIATSAPAGTVTFNAVVNNDGRTSKVSSTSWP